MNLDANLQKEKRKKKRIKPVFIIGIIGAIVVIQGLVMYSTISKYNSKIYPKVWVEDIDLGGKTKDEAKKAIIQKHNNTINKKNIAIKLNDKEYTIGLSKLGMKYDYSATIDKAYDVGRKENIFKNYFSIATPGEQKFQLNHTYNYAIVDTILKGIVKDNTKKATNASIIRSNSGQLIVTKSEYGYSVDSVGLKQDIKNKVNNIEKEQNLVIQPKLKRIEPKIKENNLKSVNTKISSFTTTFGNSSENRSENIRVASNAINGKVLMPGDAFSFNDIVGERSRERGYKTSKEIVGDKAVDGVGGGVCQVSTTLYNAVLRANIASVERYPHTLHSAYVASGMDATVAYGLLDYRFKNTQPYPIYIESTVQNKSVTFDIYSNSSLNKKKYDIVSESAGNRVSVFKVAYENGNFLSKSLLYTDTIKQ